MKTRVSALLLLLPVLAALFAGCASPLRLPADGPDPKAQFREQWFHFLNGVFLDRDRYVLLLEEDCAAAVVGRRDFPEFAVKGDLEARKRGFAERYESALAELAESYRRAFPEDYAAEQAAYEKAVELRSGGTAAPDLARYRPQFLRPWFLDDGVRLKINSTFGFQARGWTVAEATRVSAWLDEAAIFVTRQLEDHASPRALLEKLREFLEDARKDPLWAVAVEEMGPGVERVPPFYFDSYPADAVRELENKSGSRTLKAHTHLLSQRYQFALDAYSLMFQKAFAWGEYATILDRNAFLVKGRLDLGRPVGRSLVPAPRVWRSSVESLFLVEGYLVAALRGAPAFGDRVDLFPQEAFCERVTRRDQRLLMPF